MDVLFQQLLPLGGAGSAITFIAYLLLHERKQWREDRAALIAEHRDEIAEQEERHRLAEADLERSNQRLRDELRLCRGGED